MGGLRTQQPLYKLNLLSSLFTKHHTGGRRGSQSSSSKTIERACGRCAAGGDEVVDEHHLLTRLYGVDVHLNLVLTILQHVSR